jgi:hypothetical protein
MFKMKVVIVLTILLLTINAKKTVEEILKEEEEKYYIEKAKGNLYFMKFPLEAESTLSNKTRKCLPVDRQLEKFV